MKLTTPTTNLINNSERWIIRFARTGLAAKGIVYCVVGALAFMAAFEINGASEQDTGKQGVFQFILEQPYGRVLLALTAIGMLCYTAWRFIQTIKDTERKGKDTSGIGKRIGYAFSGAVYLTLAVLAAKLVLGQPGSDNGSSSDTRQTLARELLMQPFGEWLLGAVALGTIVIGFYQIYRAYSGSYMKKINSSEMNDDFKKILIRAGKVGYVARGIVWMVIGFLFMKAALAANAMEAGGTSKALKLIETNSYGSLVLGAVAFGLICYGVFMFVRARYEYVRTK